MSDKKNANVNESRKKLSENMRETDYCKKNSSSQEQKRKSKPYKLMNNSLAPSKRKTTSGSPSLFPEKPCKPSSKRTEAPS